MEEPRLSRLCEDSKRAIGPVLLSVGILIVCYCLPCHCVLLVVCVLKAQVSHHQMVVGGGLLGHRVKGGACGRLG